jgi:Na+/melibiose symporter-like transporter
MKHDLSENFSKKYKNSLSVWNKLGYGMGEAGSQFI